MMKQDNSKEELKELKKIVVKTLKTFLSFLFLCLIGKLVIPAYYFDLFTTIILLVLIGIVFKSIKNSNI